jgi:hypothetical protein
LWNGKSPGDVSSAQHRGDPITGAAGTALCLHEDHRLDALVVPGRHAGRLLTPCLERVKQRDAIVGLPAVADLYRIADADPVIVIVAGVVAPEMGKVFRREAEDQIGLAASRDREPQPLARKRQKKLVAPICRR